jgi:hypothetical protein
MTISRPLALVIITGTGIGGAFIGRATRNDAPNVGASASVSPAPSSTTPSDDECEAERTALTSIKAQLATCLTIDTAFPETAPPGALDTAPSGAPDTAPSGAPETPESRLQASLAEEIRLYNERLESLPEAVVVRHSSGMIRVYSPDEWPVDGDGVIIKRKFKDGRIERYPVLKRPSAPAGSTP